MSFNEKYKFYKDNYGLLGLSFEQYSILNNLFGFLYKKLKEKNEDLTVMDIFDKIVPEKEYPTVSKFMKEPFCIQLKYHLEENYNFKNPSSLGLKSVADIKSKIIEIVSSWLPF